VILDDNHEIVGTPWRGNLRECINSCSTSAEWIAALFDLCGSGISPESGPVTLAIDTPLGFSEAFIQLVTQSKAAACIEASNTNSYLLGVFNILCQPNMGHFTRTRFEGADQHADSGYTPNRRQKPNTWARV